MHKILRRIGALMLMLALCIGVAVPCFATEQTVTASLTEEERGYSSLYRSRNECTSGKTDRPAEIVFRACTSYLESNLKFD